MSSHGSGTEASKQALHASTLISIADAADRWSVSPRSVWRWIAAGDIKVVKLGRAVRIPVSEIDRIARQGVR